MTKSKAHPKFKAVKANIANIIKKAQKGGPIDMKIGSGYLGMPPSKRDTISKTPPTRKEVREEKKLLRKIDKTTNKLYRNTKSVGGSVTGKHSKKK